MPDEIDAAAIVARARAEADAITARAEVEAQAARGRSEADAQAIRARARVEADELEARAHGDREHAARLLAEAEQRSAQLLSEAESVRRSADDIIERLVATRRELETVIEHLARLPHTVLDLTGIPSLGEEPALGDTGAAVDVIDGDALADRDAVPLGASVSSRGGGASGAGEGSDPELPPTEADDPVARMVRSAIDRAARAGSAASSGSPGPAELRETLRSPEDPD